MLAFRGDRNAPPAVARGAFFVGACFFGPFEAVAEAPCEAFAKTEKVAVAQIYDGDTLKLRDGRNIRLIGINATEVGHRGASDQPFARAASRAVEDFVAKAGELELLLDRQASDHYGRTLAHLYNGRGENLEQFLLAQGLAYHVAIPPNLTLAACLAAAEQQARIAKKGLWGHRGIASVPADHIARGGFQRVRGRVTAVERGKQWRLSLDNHLTAITYPENQQYFDPLWFDALLGRQVELQGWVYRSRGEWRIKLETPYAVLIP
ncbi:thermonuclease family protein [Porticoccus sp.]